MLTSAAAQYLHPDYLQPLPTTLDAKKSPLALLAQTCSSIGKDTTPSKSLIPPLDKKDSQGTNHSNSKPSTPSNKGTSTPEDNKSHISKDHSDKHESGSPGATDKSGFRAPAPKDIPPLVPISSGDRSPGQEKSDRPRSSSPSTSTSAANLTNSSRISLNCGSVSLEVNHSEAAGIAKTTLASSHSSLPSTLRGSESGLGGFHSSLGAYPGCAIPMFGHYPVDPAAAQHIPPSALAGHNGLSTKLPGHPPGLSPYTYARVKTTAGATTLVPICRDPYCTNCQITLQNAQLTACAAGCTQCSHEKAVPPTSLPLGHSGLPSSIGSLPVLPGLSGSPLASSLYSHAFGVLPGHASMPYVCNWMAGSDYCGKRFNTSEELLQHLRTHTSSSDTAALAGLSAVYPGLAGYPAAALAGCQTPHYPSAASLSPNSLRQAYPRSLSPNTLLAASRYHPYKSPLSGLTVPSAPLPSTLPPGLGAYYSPYTLYGQRLGAVAP